MTLSILILSIFYMLVLSIVYFRKKHIESEEIHIFNKLIIINIIGLLIEITCKLMCFYLTTANFITELFAKFYLLYIILFSMFMTYYVYNISHDNSLKKNNFIYKLINLFVIFISIGVIILPIKFESLTSDYCTGFAVNLVYAYCIILIFYCLIEMFTHFKNLKAKKCLPLIVFFIGMFIGAIIQRYYPQITITTVVESFVLFIMYFTIENPDIKMIEQLNLAKEQADKANLAKTDFLSSMSHEIRTPLNAIVGFSECLLQSENLDEAKENASDIVSASNTLLEIVNGILDISKIEAGKIEIHNSSYNSKELFDSIVKLIKGRLGDKPLDFRVSIAEDIPETLYGDHSNLKKIIINLLTNAVKYTDKGYFSLKINCVQTNDVSRLIISVEDSGRGIKKEDINKLFTKFQRLDEDRNTTIEGTGLGLAITKQLIELMGGKIVVQSTFGEGSKFTVALDQRIVDTKVEASVPLEQYIDLTGKRILVVDDNSLNLKVAKKILDGYNLNIDTALSGMECLDKIKKGEQYDLILMDDMMPRMSGSETLLRLKKLENFKTPVVALTANAISGMQEKYINAGFDNYLSKPIEKDKLHNILATLVNNPNDVKKEEINIKTIPEENNIVSINTEMDRILVVDDNKLNIKVAITFLKIYNPIIEFVESGQECLDKIQNGEQYDLIFMDDMMPNMSGVETFHNLEKIDNFNTPVVVLTANALDGMREKYLQEGFIEYLSKPINKNELYRILSLIFEDSKEETENKDDNIYKEKINTQSQFSSVYVTEEEKTNSIEYLKNHNIDIDNSLKLLGSIETYNELLKEFYDNLNSRVNKLVEYKNKSDMENYAILIHAIKSDSKYLGFNDLAKISYNQEMASKQNNISFINSTYNNLYNELKNIYSIIKKYLEI